jgi:prephenate dehydrogenase
MDNPDIPCAEPYFLSTARVAVLGLGLMGASLAMALKGGCKSLLGVDPDQQVLTLALERGIVSMASADPRRILPQSDLVILAAPVGEILNLIETFPSLHPGPAVVIDLGSTKSRIVEAMAGLPDRFDPIGGHPMCGKESNSIVNADPDLYKDAPFALTRLPRSSTRACRLAEELVHKLGARPVWLDPISHDRFTARTSHFPYIVANLLALITPPNASILVGPGFRSTTRVASTPTSVMLDILMTNRFEILSALADFRLELDLIESYMANLDQVSLKELLEMGASRRQGLLGAVRREGEP